jgi:hypothetical protein
MMMSDGGGDGSSTPVKNLTSWEGALAGIVPRQTILMTMGLLGQSLGDNVFMADFENKVGM